MNQLSHKYGTYDTQKKLLEMISDINRLFEVNDIEYSLCGGTLLGAVRENGFIPWDDDIDIMVDRKNYDKIVRLFKSMGEDAIFVLHRHLWIDRIQCRNINNEMLEAETIDLFVMDNCPDSMILRRLKVLLIKTLQGMMKEKPLYDGFSIFQRVCLWLTHTMGMPFNNETKFKWYHNIAKIGNKKRTKYLTGYTDLYKTLSLRYSRDLFTEIIKHKFEDIELPITSEYDSYLRTQYGDYTIPPDEENRIPMHSI